MNSVNNGELKRQVELLFLSILLVPAWTCVGSIQVDWLNSEDIYHLVDPAAGSAKKTEGYVIPAASVPFGNILVAPENQEEIKKCVPPYFYENKNIRGIRLSHWISGSCTQDYGYFTFGSFLREYDPDITGRYFPLYDHSNEVSEPALYKISQLFDGQIAISATATSHAAIIQTNLTPNKYRMTEHSKGKDLVFTISPAGLYGDGNCSVVSVSEKSIVIAGSSAVYRLYLGGGTFAGFSHHLFAELDLSSTPGSSIVDYGLIENSKSKSCLKFNLTECFVKATQSIKKVGLYVMIRTTRNPDINQLFEWRAGVSSVDIDGARNNLVAEIPKDVASFASIYNQTKEKWKSELSSVIIGRHRVGSTAEDVVNLKKFYTGIYRTYLLPREFSDVDGRFPSFGGGKKINKWSKDRSYYVDFSAWDTFRALHPFITIIKPKRSYDYAMSLLQKGMDGGWLPIFPVWNSYTTEMIGDHVVAILGDMILKDIIKDPQIKAKMYKLMRKNAMEIPTPEEYGQGKGRRFIDIYLKYGFLPIDVQADKYKAQSSRTIEYSMDDSVLASVACHLLMHENESPNENQTYQKDCEIFKARSKWFMNVIDPDFGFVNTRTRNGTFTHRNKAITPIIRQDWLTEGTPWIWTFTPMHDVRGLMKSLNLTRPQFIKKLDTFFALGQYEHGNEPSHHAAFFYNHVGAYSRTQERVWKVRNTMYGVGPDGICGNDDAGQMSAWFVIASIGFYQVSPHSPRYDITTPLFKDVVVHLENGNSLKISTYNTDNKDYVGEKVEYITSARWNGKCLNRPYLLYSEIMQGGTLEYETTYSQPAEIYGGCNAFCCSSTQASYS